MSEEEMEKQIAILESEGRRENRSQIKRKCFTNNLNNKSICHILATGIPNRMPAAFLQYS